MKRNTKTRKQSKNRKRDRKSLKERKERRRHGGEFPWIELPPEIPLVNIFEETPPIWEQEVVVTKPFTNTVVIMNRVYIFYMDFDPEKQSEPQPVYVYVGDVGTIWEKDSRANTNKPIVSMNTSTGSRIEEVYRELDLQDGQLVEVPSSHTYTGFDVFKYDQSIPSYDSTTGEMVPQMLGTLMNSEYAGKVKSSSGPVNNSQAKNKTHYSHALQLMILEEVGKKMA